MKRIIRKKKRTPVFYGKIGEKKVGGRSERERERE